MARGMNLLMVGPSSTKALVRQPFIERWEEKDTDTRHFRNYINQTSIVSAFPEGLDEKIG